MADYSHMNALQLTGQSGADGAGLLLSAGTAASRATVASAGNFVEFRAQGTHTTGDVRAIYDRLYIAGAGGSGEALRAYTTVDDVVAGLSVHGAHISLDFDSTAGSGSVTGLGVAARATLHIPSDASWAPGTISALQAEIYSDGAASDTDGATSVSFIRVVNDGHADGKADVDDDASLLSLVGFTIGAGNMIQAEVDETKFSHKFRIDVDGTPYYLMATAT